MSSINFNDHQFGPIRGKLSRRQFNAQLYGTLGTGLLGSCAGHYFLDSSEKKEVTPNNKGNLDNKENSEARRKLVRDLNVVPSENNTNTVGEKTKEDEPGFYWILGLGGGAALGNGVARLMKGELEKEMFIEVVSYLKDVYRSDNYKYILEIEQPDIPDDPIPVPSKKVLLTPKLILNLIEENLNAIKEAEPKELAEPIIEKLEEAKKALMKKARYKHLSSIDDLIQKIKSLHEDKDEDTSSTKSS